MWSSRDIFQGSMHSQDTKHATTCLPQLELRRSPEELEGPGERVRQRFLARYSCV